MAEIPLIGGKVAIIDDDDLPRVSQYSWRLKLSVPPRTALYAWATVNDMPTTLHRFIMNSAPGQEVDHANRDGLDNRRINLRFCTRSQNSANRLYRPGASGYRGVTFRPDCKPSTPYRASVRVQSRRITAGYFADALAAAIEYDRVAREHFGEFALVNFPLEIGGQS